MFDSPCWSVYIPWHPNKPDWRFEQREMQGLPVVVVLATASDRSFLPSGSCVSAPWLRQKQSKSWKVTELANSLLKVQYTKYISWIFMNWKNALCLLKAIRTSATRRKCFFPPLGTLNVWLEMSFYFKRFWQPWRDQKPRVGRLGQFWLVPSLQGAGAIQRRAAETHGVIAWWRGPSKVWLSLVGFIVTSSDIKGHHTSQIIYVHLQNLVLHLFCIFLQMDITWYDLNLAFWQCRSSQGVMRLIESLQTVHATLLAHLHVPCSKLDWHQNPRISFPEFSSLERMCACVAQFSTDPFSLWCAKGTWQQHVVSYGLTMRESTG